jgi:hypothetical protein
MWQQHFKAILIIIFLFGVGIGLTIFGWKHVHDAQRLEKSSAVAEGRVISSSTERLSRGGQSSTAVVEYVPSNHPAITKKFYIDSDDYQTAQSTGKLKVTYLPEDPQVSIVTDFAIMPFQILIGLGSLMILAGLFCLIHAVLNRAKV